MKRLGTLANITTLVRGAVFVVPFIGFLLFAQSSGPTIFQYGFEARGPVWRARNEDAPYKVLAHRLTEDTAHGGQRSEHIQLLAEKGSYIHYVFPVGRAPITEDLNAGLWLKATRPGVQLLCRVVLPRERDPHQVNQPLTVLVRCEPYQNTRWKFLTLNQPVKRLQEQQQLLRHQLGRDVNVMDAYVSEMVLNLYDGPGQIDVWIDDLEIGPVIDAPQPGLPTKPDETQAPATPAATAQRGPHRADTVDVNGSQLIVNGQRMFVRGIRHTGVPLDTLRDAGFNTLWLGESASDKTVEKAVALGFWMVPSITPPQFDPSGRIQGTLVSRDSFVNTVSRISKREGILALDIGSNLPAESHGDISRVVNMIRSVDPMRPIAIDVWDGFQAYSRSIDSVMLGVHRWPLMTSLEIEQYRDWLLQRRRLAAPGTFCWTWVQNHLPDWFTKIAPEGPDKMPLGPQPEQVRLLAYAAIGCGYRGVAFWSDESLADSKTGRDRLLGLAALNQELQMLEPILVEADASKEPEWIDTSRGEVKASILRTPKGILVLPVWLGGGAQYCPGQSTFSELDLTIPLVPATASCWEVSPGGIRAYKTERVLGGVKVKLRNFSLTTALLFTSDLGPTGLVVRLQDQQRRMGAQAAQWAQDQAREELAKVEKVQAALEQLGKQVPDAKGLLQKAQEAVARCIEHRRNGDHVAAYADAHVALRGLRLLMRAQWEKAVRNLDTPVASPWAVSYFTLPQHWKFMDELHQLAPGENAIDGGDFEAPPEKAPPGWLVQEVPTLDAVNLTARRVKDKPYEGKQCLQLRVDNKAPLSPHALERTFLAIHSPAAKLAPGTPVRITVWVRTGGLGGTADGALIYDSAGGEPLAVRVRGTKGWRRYQLYRKVPESGKINVTMAVSGMGEVFFDDVRIDSLVPASSARAAKAPPTSPAGTQGQPAGSGRAAGTQALQPAAWQTPEQRRAAWPQATQR